MAIELITKKWCDLHLQQGEEVDGETITVVINGGKKQSIELCDVHQKELITPLQDLLTAEGRGNATKAPAKAAKPATSTAKSKEIRAWGRANGFDVPSRGVIPNDVRDAYAAAH